MCNLYGVRVSLATYLAHFQAAEDWRNQMSIEKDYVAPGKPGMVIRQQEGQRVLSTMLWGFPTKEPRKRAPKEGQLPFTVEWWTNARNLGSNMWKGALSRPEQRCLVPFDRFAEPKAKAERSGPGDVNWWFSNADGSIGAFAGIWKEDPDLGRVFSFLTCEPNPLVAPKHPKAMPVILAPEDYDTWLSTDYPGACALAQPYPSQLMSVA